MFDDGQRTETVTAQHGLENKLVARHEAFLNATDSQRLEMLKLRRQSHIGYLQKHLEPLPEHYSMLEANYPWMTYWMTHSLALLGTPVDGDVVVETIRRCQNETGGFGGGPGQLAHLASTFAAVMSLISVGSPEALSLIDRTKTERYLLRMCIPPEKGGGLRVHEDGEVDVRGCYTAIAVAYVLNLDMHLIAEKSGMVEFIKRCQTFEGGLGGEPGNEAHGGYTFCGVAAMCLLDRVEELNVAALLRWAIHMQGCMEGGFMGRTHKLVDGCYSYWQGAVFSLLKKKTPRDIWNAFLPPSLDTQESLEDLPIFEPDVRRYSAHEEAKTQGERKLGARAEELGIDLKLAMESLKKADLSSEEYVDRLRMTLFQASFTESQSAIRAVDASFGLMFPPGSVERQSLPQNSIASDQNHVHVFDALALQFWVLMHCQADAGGLRDKPGARPDLYHTCYCLSGLAAAQQYGGVVLGPEENRLTETDPFLNVVKTKSVAALSYFKSLGG